MATDHSAQGQTSDSYSLERQDEVLTDLDPHLQSLLIEQAEGDFSGAGSGIVSGEGVQMRVDVIAKLRDPEEDVPGLDVVRRNGNLVTATVKLRDVEDVRTHANVLSLKAARPVHRFLGVSVAEAGCDAPALRAVFPGLNPRLDGAGTIVGIVDSGCDFRHGNFRTAEGRTRLLSLWDQRSFNRQKRRRVKPTATPPVDRQGRSYGYGREFSAAALDVALKDEAGAFDAIDYEIGIGEHGTHVMDIAAGNGLETGRPGVAPGADLVFVHLDPGDISGESSLGNSRRLLDAVEYIFEKAEALGRSAVVNLSLGMFGGPHDGTTWAEEWFDNLLAKKGRAIVIAAGNSFSERSHAHAELGPGKKRTLSWRALLIDETPNELEVWYKGGPLEITLIQPGGRKLGPVTLGDTYLIRRDSDGVAMGQITHRRKDPGNGLHHIDVILGRRLPKGTWKVELANRGNKKVELHAWIERDDNGQSRFEAEDQDPSFTLGSIACGRSTVVVGAYDAHDGELASFSSAGPTRDGREKPDVSAPGVSVEAANSLGGSRPDNGTSMAAPHVAGLVALLFQVNDSLAASQIIELLRNSARPANGATGYDPRYGFGRISGLAALAAAGAGAAVLEDATAMPAAPPVPGPPVLTTAGTNGHHRKEMSELLAQLLADQGTVRFSIQVEPEGEA